ARETIVAHKEEVERRLLRPDGAPQEATAAARAGRRKVKRWRLGGGWSLVGPGLRICYEAAAQAFAVAVAEPAAEKLHECRKRIKDLRYQLERRAPARPRVLNRLAGLAHRLTDALGEDRDLFLLEQFLSDEPRREGAVEALNALTGPLSRRRADLQRSAFDLGHRLLADAAADFEERLRGYWRAPRRARPA